MLLFVLKRSKKSICPNMNERIYKYRKNPKNMKKSINIVSLCHETR